MKTKTKKRLKKTILFFCASMIVLIVGLYFCLGYIVKTAVIGIVPRITGTPVKMESFSFSMFSGKARMKNFVIGNPEGFSTEYAFSLNELVVEVDMDTLFSKKIVIDEIRVNGVDVIYEQGMTTSNLKEIRANVKSYTGKEKDKRQEETADSPRREEKERVEARKVQINNFYFNDVKVSLSVFLLQGAKTSIPIPDIHIEDIGKEGDGVTAGEAAVQIFNAIYKSIGKTASTGTDPVKGLGDSLKGIFK
ncbi:MAG: hypothetical protein A2X45_13875 [Lentisphaerae bacterium GWF2_50_93]|nr:MAG: hypothetical protein A2X45_13875 [Lentisphaerae bacterium GWF2_50_93]